MAVTRPGIRRATSSATGPPIECPTRMNFPSASALATVSTSAASPCTDQFSRFEPESPCPAKIDPHDPILLRERSRRLIPERTVASPAMHEHDRAVTLSEDVINDRHSVGGSHRSGRDDRASDLRTSDEKNPRRDEQHRSRLHSGDVTPLPRGSGPVTEVGATCARMRRNPLGTIFAHRGRGSHMMRLNLHVASVACLVVLTQASSAQSFRKLGGGLIPSTIAGHRGFAGRRRGWRRRPGRPADGGLSQRRQRVVRAPCDSVAGVRIHDAWPVGGHGLRRASRRRQWRRGESTSSAGRRGFPYLALNNGQGVFTAAQRELPDVAVAARRDVDGAR